MLHRQSMVSVGSFEDDERLPRRHGPLLRGSASARPLSIDQPRRRHKKNDVVLKPSADDVARSLKRKKIVDELYDTERAYVDGLNLIYSHFLLPIIESLDTPDPILNRATLTATFSNFIDIWNFHRSFFAALETSRDAVGPLLLSHFPYLSLYTPFITQFSSTISSLTDLVAVPTPARPNPHYSARFAGFLQARENDPRCGKLKLRDWLLTIVQRCPRYLLMLKDLIKNTPPDDPEHAQLTEAHGLVSKITLALNTSLHTHAQTLALLALQRATSGLPFQLISPGRNLVKRGTLLQAERNESPRPREFLLFSDCLIWLASTDAAGNSWDWEWSMSGWSSNSGGTNASGSNNPTPTSSAHDARPTPPKLVRSRSRSEVECTGPQRDGLPSSSSSHASSSTTPLPSAPSTPISPLSKALLQRRSQHYNNAPPVAQASPMAKRRSVASSDEKWVFKGRADLVDLEVTVGSVLTEERRFEINSPEGSFVVYALSDEEREEWVMAIRQAKAVWLVTLNAINPNSTLTSSASTNHIRKSLQALPFHPSDDRLADSKDDGKVLTPISKKLKRDRDKGKAEVRRKVEHWVPPIWIPDGKTNECMRCGKMFGWRRRRHHCRLCGMCVCAACSDRTFFIADTSGRAESTKPARACDACYESVFPVVDEPSLDSAEYPAPRINADTISSLANFPAWVSMPSMPVSKHSTPQALMAIDLAHSLDAALQSTQANSGQERAQLHKVGVDPRADVDQFKSENEAGLKQGRAAGAVRLRAHQKLRSYQRIVEDFQDQAATQAADGLPRHPDVFDDLEFGNVDESGRIPAARSTLVQDISALEDDDGEAEEDEGDWPHLFFTPSTSYIPPPVSTPRKRKEDTVRRSKRYSLPALALHTTPITARASMMIEEDVVVLQSPDAPPVGDPASAAASPSRPRRYSIVMSPGKSVHSQLGGRGRHDMYAEDGRAGKSLAADKLSELLGRQARS